MTPGTVKLFRGWDGGVPTATLEVHTHRTRDFGFAGQLVTCRVVEERSYEAGELVEISLHHLAQDDRGAVATFGEVSWTWEEDDGEEPGLEEDSWLVGGPTQAGDPQGIHAASAPGTYMPADPQVGDVFDQQPLPAASETLTVLALDADVGVQAGRFADTLLLEEQNELDPGAVTHLWVAPGVGLVREEGEGSQLELVALSLAPHRP